MFQVGDKTVLPLTPVRFRAGTSPRRKTERINTVNGVTVSSSEEIIYAYSLAQGWLVHKFIHLLYIKYFFDT